MKLSKIMAIALAVACLLTGCWQEEPPEEPEEIAAKMREMAMWLQ